MYVLFFLKKFLSFVQTILLCEMYLQKKKRRRKGKNKKKKCNYILQWKKFALNIRRICMNKFFFYFCKALKMRTFSRSIQYSFLFSLARVTSNFRYGMS